jgi:hypothetical protein
MDIPAKLLEQSALLAKQAAELINSRKNYIQQQQEQNEHEEKEQETHNENISGPTDETGSQTNPEPPQKPIPFEEMLEDGSFSSLPDNSVFLKKSVCMPCKFTRHNTDPRNTIMIRSQSNGVIQLKYIKFKDVNNFSLKNIRINIGNVTNTIPAFLLTKRVIKYCSINGECEDYVYEFPDFLSLYPQFMVSRPTSIKYEFTGGFFECSLHGLEHYIKQNDMKYFLNRNMVRTRFPQIQEGGQFLTYHRKTLQNTRIVTEYETYLDLNGKTNGIFIDKFPIIDKIPIAERIEIFINNIPYMDMDRTDIEAYTQVNENNIYIPFDGNKDYRPVNNKLDAINFSRIDEAKIRITIGSRIPGFIPQQMKIYAITNNISVYKNGDIKLLYPW